LPNRYDFSLSLYRSYNLDLAHLSDESLFAHFLVNQKDRRVYAKTDSTVEFLSMRWLRGDGFEVGAGAHPTPLYGNARALLSDCDDSHAFGGERVDIAGSVNDPDFWRDKEDNYDFVVASHVLEHVDSLLLAIDNLIKITRNDGAIYITVPDICFIRDKEWMPHYNFEHHIDEYNHPHQNDELHDNIFIEYIKSCDINKAKESMHARLEDDYLARVRRGSILESERFMHHKHNYDFNGWLDILHQSKCFFSNKIKFVDARYGHERMDCHFVFQVTK
jgi:predicted SAM-dependent methyltransferase